MSDPKSFESNQFYDEISDTYSSLYAGRVHYNLAVDHYLSSHPNLASFKKVLDIGSGDGDRITRLFSKRALVVAVEESKGMCSLLRKHTGITKIFECSINELSSDDLGTDFDLVTMQWNVLGHISEHNSLFQICREVLKSNGRLIFDVNNPLNVKQYGVASIVRNSFYFNFYPRKKRKFFPLKMGMSETQVSYSPTSYYVKTLHRFGFEEIKAKFFDYDTGKVAHRYTGQVLFDAVKS